MVRLLWTGFSVSLVAVVYLCLAEITGKAPIEDSRTPPGVAGKAVEPAAKMLAPVPPPADPAPVADSAAASPDPGENDAATPSSPRPSPADFMRELMDLVQKGDMESLTRHVSPGVARISSNLMMLMMAGKLGREEDKEQLKKAMEGIQFEFEELGDGLIQVHAQGPDGTGPPEKLYLVPTEEGSWELAVESDLPGPAAEKRDALNLIQLLALCQHTYLMEGLGTTANYARTMQDLANGLDGSPLYAGVLDPEFVGAAGRGLPYGGYAYGRVETGGEGFGYYAVPADYGSSARETLLIDNQGRIWAKDLEGAPPPETWPGPDPEKQGWKQRKGSW